MFDTTGKTIKKIAYALLFIGIAVSVAIGFISLPAGIIIIPIGCLLSWLTSLFIYGFGQLIENTDILVKTLVTQEENQVTTVPKITVSPVEDWTCVSCGSKNARRVPFCNSCGTSRDWSESRKHKEKDM